MSAVPPLEKNVDEKHILFPTEDESTGIVLIGWRGCNVSVSTSFPVDIGRKLNVYKTCNLRPVSAGLFLS